MPKLLILSSNPRRDLNLEREVSDLVTAVQRLGQFEIGLRLGVRSQELPGALAEHTPQVVHFCGHGAGEQGLVFQNEQGQEQFVSTEILARLFNTFANEINCVVLNACDSDRQAEAIVNHINYVIGMSQPILDKAAYCFATGFYQGLAAGKSIEQSYELGCIAIQIWSETESPSIQTRSTQNKQYRKLEYAGEISQLAQPELLEHLKPVLRKKPVPLPSSSEESSVQTGRAAAPADLPPGFEAVVRQEIDRKEYKDQARAAYDHFGQYSAENAAFLTKSEYEQRKILVRKVRQFWIEGFLKSSLQGFAAARLGLKDRPDAIANLAQGIEALSVELDASYEQLRSTQIYGEIGQGRTLLILGEPGAGKTVALLQLAQRLIDRCEQDLSLPMPVVFNLSSWAKDRKSIVDWVSDELREKYQVHQGLSDDWLTQQQLILLLDGLDEVNLDYRNHCVRALNEFIALYPQTEIAICSRVRDYEALTERLHISSALCLQPFTSKQIGQFLDGVGGSLAGLKTLLRHDREVEQFAQNPLILSLMSVAYQGWSVENLRPPLCSPSERLLHLMDTYIDRRLARGTASQYSRDDVLRWLSWLASRMVQEKQTIFLIEKMQPGWLHQSEQKLYQMVSRGMGGSIEEIVPLEQLNWSWQRARSRVIRDVLAGVMSGLLFWLVMGWVMGMIALWITGSDNLNWVLRGLISGFIFGFIFGLIFGLGSGLGSTEITQRVIPNQGIHRSVRNCLAIGLCGGLLSGLLSGLGFALFGLSSGQILNLSGEQFFGLIGGLIAGLRYGGVACIQHFTLRRILYQNGRIPWNYAKFLDFASDRLLMKKIGGGYVFFHRMLLEHFAQMNLNVD